MRKRPILLATAALAAGLGIYRSVSAQQPVSVVPPPSKTTARPATPPAGGYLPAQPAQGANGRPRLTQPVMAGADGVRPAGGFDIPPPSLELPSFQPPPAAAPTTPPAAPPTVPPLPQPPVAKDVPPPEPTLPPLPASPQTEARPLVPVPAPPTPPTGGVPLATTPQPIGPGALPTPAPIGPATPVPGGPAASTPPAFPVTPVTPAAPPTPGVSVTPAPFPTPDLTPGALTPPSTPVTPRPTPPPLPAFGGTPAFGGLPGKATHTVTVEAVCPESVGLGAELRYELIVRNTGTSSVANVRVEDEIPSGTKYVGSDPPAEQNADRLGWSVGTLEAGAEKRIAVRVMPTAEGEIRSRATVVYSAAVEARTKVTRPRISVAVTGPDVSKAGEEPLFNIKVTNSGSGPAQRMVLQAFLSEGLVHPQGAKLEMELTNLAAGETKTVPLKVVAGKAGQQWCQVTVTAQGSPDAVSRAAVNVLEPQLKIAQAGPAKCFVRAEPVYEIGLSNPGTAATDPVTVFAVLPEGFEFLQASEGATFNPANRAVVWKIAGLAPGGTKAFTLKVRATAEGDGLLRTIAHATPEQAGIAGAGGVAVRPAGRVLEAKAETAIRAEGVAAVRFEVRDLDDPVEVGNEAVYEVRVLNQGTGACTNVQIVAALAEGTTYTGSSGPTQAKAQGQNLIFDPIPNLGVKGEAVYRVKVRGSAAGDMRFRVQLTCDQVRTPVVKEESTQFVKQ